jgi:PAS domain S-box-containing protein
LTQDVAGAGGASPAPRPRIPWHVVYYLLAGFDVLAVCAAVLLSRQFVGVSLRAVAREQEWAGHLDEYAGLQQLASRANAPGNDVFASRDVPRESARLAEARAAFDDRLARLQRHLVESHPEEAAPLLARMRDMEAAMRAMAAEAAGTFRRLDAGDAQGAAQRMADMDRAYARVLTALHALRGDVVLLQRGLLAGQAADLRRLQVYELGVIALVVVMVGAAIAYGTRIEREMRREAEARARYVRGLRGAEDALRKAQGELEQRVVERTQALVDSEAALRQSAAEWRRTFDAIESPVLVLDLEGRLVRANAAARAVTGAAPAEGVTGRVVASLASAEPWATVSSLVERVRDTGQPASAPARDEAGGRSWDVTASPAPAQEGEAGRVIVVTRDTTREHKLQETLRREETMAAMGALVAGVAHEVRNPLFAITSTLDGFEARFGSTPGLEKYFPVLRREATRLGQLARDLLEYARPPQLESGPTSLRSVLADALRACTADASAAGVVVEEDVAADLPPVAGDAPRLAQVFQNVIHNAVVHTPRGGRVLVSARLGGATDARWVDCRVADRGPGFRPEDLPRVFEPLFTRRAGGTGLGLAIAHRIVEMHGGTMTAANAPGGGAIVTVSLPVASALVGAPRADMTHA